MKLYRIIYSLSVVIVCGLSLFGQSRVQKAQIPPAPKPTPNETVPILRFDPINPNATDNFKIGEIKGNVGNAKAIRLPKPIYPEAVKIDGIEGKVKVEFTINENGVVESPKAVSGPPELYESAQTAALGARFLPPSNNSPLKGYLIYHFIIETPNWFQVGYDLRVFFLTEPAVLAKAFSPDWSAESELIGKLKEFRRREPVRPPKLTQIETSSQNSAQKNSARIEGQIRFENSVPIPRSDEEMIRTTQSLIDLLKTRLADNPKNLWQFNLGLVFLETQVLVRNPNAGIQAFTGLREMSENAPPDTPPVFLEKLKSLLERSNSTQNFDARTEIARTIAELKTFKNAN